MKTLRTKKMFCSNKGESLIESVISLFILSILILAVTSIIQVSLRMSNRSIANAAVMQENVLNPLLRSEFDGDGIVGAVTFNFVPTSGNTDPPVDNFFEFDAIAISQNALIYNQGGLWAFSPQADGGGEP
ncbi:MAG: prepilin-type N-terminal cleavage/methylation domain-containing protein [Lachnospiraceae bacterium]|nr:prepilin-type N-terminal cleavage/methylation domain-containing protein [Lachnospiraceae bacterium]